MAFPISPADNDTFTEGNVTYRYSSAEDSWELDRELDANEAARSQIAELKAEALSASNAYSVYDAEYYINVSSSGVASPLDPFGTAALPSSGDPFNTIASAVAWLKTAKLRPNASVVMTLAGQTHSIASALALDIGGLRSLTIRGNLADLNTSSLSIHVIPATSADAATRKASLAAAITTAGVSVLRFDGSAGSGGSINGGSIAQLRIENTIVEKAAGYTLDPANLIVCGDMNTVVLKDCYVRNLLTSTTIYSVRSLVFLDSCVLVDSRVGSFWGGTVVMTECLAMDCQSDMVQVRGATALVENSTLTLAGISNIDCNSGNLYVLGSNIHEARSSAGHNIVIRGTTTYLEFTYIRRGTAGLTSVCSTIRAVNLTVNGCTQGGIRLHGGFLFLTLSTITNNSYIGNPTIRCGLMLARAYCSVVTCTFSGNANGAFNLNSSSNLIVFDSSGDLTANIGMNNNNIGGFLSNAF